MLADALGRRRARARFRLQAVIAAQHANARTYADTDWPAIAGGYAQLDEHTGSPVVRLNHAVAVAEADGPHAGLRLLDTVDGLDDFHLLHATRAELLARAGEDDAARTAFARALALTDNPAEQRLLDRRLPLSRRRARRACRGGRGPSCASARVCSTTSVSSSAIARPSSSPRRAIGRPSGS